MTGHVSRAMRGTLRAASEHGGGPTLLRRLRTSLCERLDDPLLSPRDFAALSRRLLDVEKELHPPVRTQPDPLIPGEPVPDAPFDAWSI